MYNVSTMKSELDNALAVVQGRIRDQFAVAFENIYGGGMVPHRFSAANPRIDVVQLTTHDDLAKIYSGQGFYIILSDRPVDGNSCRLSFGALRAIYRGECGTVRKRIQSHLLNSRYNAEYQARASRYNADPKNKGKLFYEPHWAHCIKLDAGGPSGIDINLEPHNRYSWVVLVHRMNESSQEVRKLAELAFDDAFGHPAGSRDTKP
ncbi:MAG TPA: hypothetical protein VJ698_14105 [Noviherbaspirillum sp.]|uniref:hypothetical protein n=1 Tax=Noviherbaspirillum sp. TaxID=1926288 RepID=UPI002B47732E|nr:hypothetical protein [Noviherbaspirillum sp.]HJV86600.1 hypothetical protein [Noviherbaspirillum sp.]